MDDSPTMVLFPKGKAGMQRRITYLSWYGAMTPLFTNLAINAENLPSCHVVALPLPTSHGSCSQPSLSPPTSRNSAWNEKASGWVPTYCISTAEVIMMHLLLIAGMLATSPHNQLCCRVKPVTVNVQPTERIFQITRHWSSAWWSSVQM